MDHWFGYTSPPFWECVSLVVLSFNMILLTKASELVRNSKHQTHKDQPYSILIPLIFTLTSCAWDFTTMVTTTFSASCIPILLRLSPISSFTSV